MNFMYLNFKDFFDHKHKESSHYLKKAKAGHDLNQIGPLSILVVINNHKANPSNNKPLNDCEERITMVTTVIWEIFAVKKILYSSKSTKIKHKIF